MASFLYTKVDAMYIIMPGIIDGYDDRTRRVAVTPIYRTETGNEFTNAPPITGVPIFVFGGGNGQIQVTPKRGDACLLLWSQRSIAEWKTDPTKTVTVSGDFTPFQRSDAFALCGFANRIHSTLLSVDEDTIELETSAASIRIKPDGSIDIAVEDSKRVNVGGTGGKRLVTEDFIDRYNQLVSTVNGLGGSASQVNKADNVTEKLFAE